MNSDRVMPTGRVPLVQRRQNEVSEGLQRRLGAKDLKAVSFGSLASKAVGTSVTHTQGNEFSLQPRKPGVGIFPEFCLHTQTGHKVVNLPQCWRRMARAFNWLNSKSDGPPCSSLECLGTFLKCTCPLACPGKHGLRVTI